jgi:hypothetical protein
MTLDEVGAFRLSDPAVPAGSNSDFPVASLAQSPQPRLNGTTTEATRDQGHRGGLKNGRG